MVYGLGRKGVVTKGVLDKGFVRSATLMVRYAHGPLRSWSATLIKLILDTPIFFVYTTLHNNTECQQSLRSMMITRVGLRRR